MSDHFTDRSFEDLVQDLDLSFLTQLKHLNHDHFELNTYYCDLMASVNQDALAFLRKLHAWFREKGRQVRITWAFEFRSPETREWLRTLSVGHIA